MSHWYTGDVQRVLNKDRQYFGQQVDILVAKHGRPQVWAKGGTCPSGNVVKCFCALVVTAKRSIDELFMHYFHNLSSASPQDPTGAPPTPTPEGLSSRDP